MAVAGETLSPRLRLVGSAYSRLAGKSANSDLLQGKDTTGFVRTGQANSVTSNMIVNGTIAAADLGQMGASAGQVMKWTGSAWAPRNDSVGGGGSGDSAWVRGTPDSVLYTIRQLGIARGGASNMLYGSLRQTQVNLGVACTTGYSGSDYGYVTVSGGYQNSARDSFTTVSGGQHNVTYSSYDVVGGGQQNAADGPYATVGGGYLNYATTHSTVGGGYMNAATWDWDAVGGGNSDTASGGYSTVSGGHQNTASGGSATVGGGHNNAATGNNATVAGGSRHVVSQLQHSWWRGSEYRVRRQRHSQRWDPQRGDGHLRHGCGWVPRHIGSQL